MTPLLSKRCASILVKDGNDRADAKVRQVKSTKFPVAIALGALLVALAQTSAGAQEAASGSDAGSAGTAPAIMPAGAPRPDQGLVFEGWMVYPSFFGGYVFNDNAYATPTNRVSTSGLRLSPSVEASQDNGLHKNMISVGVDAQLYPGVGGQTRAIPGQTAKINDAAPSNATGHGTVAHIWTPTEDITVWLSGGYVRQNGLFGASPSTNGFGAGVPGVSSFVLAPAFIPTVGTFSAQQQYSNQGSGQVAVEKKVNERISLRGSAYGSYVWYDSVPTETALVGGVPVKLPSGNGQNGTSFGASVRGSFYATPQIYVYGEPGLDLRRYDNTAADSNGYRVTAGVGSELISLFKGEIYGGYQGQTSVHGYYGSNSAPTFGARVFYFPTPDLTFSLFATSSLGVVQPTQLGGAYPLGFLSTYKSQSVSITDQVMLQGDYVVNNYLSLSARGGYGETRTQSPGYTNEIWTAGASAGYSFWRNMSVMLNYQFQKTDVKQSTVSVLTSGYQQGFSQNSFSAGLRYTY